MSEKRLRLMILTHASDRAVTIIERILALSCAEVAGIFVETETSRRRGLTEKLKRSLRYDGYGGTLAKAVSRLRLSFRSGSPPGPPGNDAVGMFAASRARLQTIAAAKGAPVHFVTNFHLPDSLALMRETAADLGVVLGTNILKEVVFSIPRLGCINLHQGLAPYYRGGPTVFWELFNGESEVGVTVHFVAAKVDTGAIVAQETLPLLYDYAHGLDYEAFIAEYRNKLAERSTQLVPQAIRMLAEGTATLRPQNLELGKRYRLPVKREKDELRRRLRERLRQSNYTTASNVKLGAGNG